MQQGYQEVEPTVYDGVMFLANVQDIVQALDATTGDLLWEYRRDLPDNIANVTGTRYRYRNVSIYDDKIFLATNDAYLVALDAFPIIGSFAAKFAFQSKGGRVRVYILVKDTPT